MSENAKRGRGRPKGSAKKDTVSEEFKNAVAAMQTTELKERVYTLSKYEEEATLALKNDDELTLTKEKLKEMSTPYKETLKTLRQQRAYVIKTMQERGT